MLTGLGGQNSLSFGGVNIVLTVGRFIFPRRPEQWVVGDILFPILALYKMTHAVTDGDLVGRRMAPSPKVRCCSALGRIKKSKLRSEQYTGSVGNYSSRLWEAGLKLVADGSPHCGTAATQEPYMTGPLTDILGFPPAPGYGTLNMASDALYDTIKRSHLQGKQFAIHCHGERSSEQVLRAYEQVRVQLLS